MKRDNSRQIIIKIVMVLVTICVLFMTNIFYNYFIKHRKEAFTTTTSTENSPSSDDSNESNTNDNNNNNNNEADVTNNSNNKTNNNNTNVKPEPNLAPSSVMYPNQKSNKLSTTDINQSDSDPNSFFKDWSPYAKKWPCSMNVTGTFTECGPDAYNSCGCNRF